LLVSPQKKTAAFMAFYRQTFPTATILPKMHILEDHVIPWMRRWHIGAGLMGEQGAESIHAHFNRIEMQYNGIVNPLDRLRYVFNEHNVESTPGLNTLRPEPRNTENAPEMTHHNCSSLTFSSFISCVLP